jgi:steroid delta-isomerase-like uncharacterized protein
MTVEENKALVQRVLAALTRDPQAAMREFVTPDFIDHDPMPGAPAGTREGVTQGIVFLMSMFGDLTLEVDELLADGDKVIARTTWRGTPQRSFMGRPAADKVLTMGSIHIFRVANGKLVEHWAQQDRLGMMRQLGIVPPAPSTLA